MNKSLSKNVMLDNLTPMVMILLATVCNIMTIAVFALSGCSGALVQKTAKDPKISAHLMYTVSGFDENKVNFQNSDTFYAYEVLVSDEDGQTQLLKIKSLSAIEHK